MQIHAYPLDELTYHQVRAPKPGRRVLHVFRPRSHWPNPQGTFVPSFRSFCLSFGAFDRMSLSHTLVILATSLSLSHSLSLPVCQCLFIFIYLCLSFSLARSLSKSLYTNVSPTRTYTVNPKPKLHTQNSERQTLTLKVSTLNSET